jgi:hypothetical protein
MSKADDEKEFRLRKKETSLLLDYMFSGEPSRISNKLTVERFCRDVYEEWEGLTGRKPYEHSTLRHSIARIFEDLDWHVEQKKQLYFKDLDRSPRFDIVATQGARRIIVEVKPRLLRGDLAQVEEYALVAKRRWKKTRVLFGTSIQSLDEIFFGETADMIVDRAERYKLGFIAADKNDAWLIPAEYVAIFAAAWKKLDAAR